MNRTNWIVAPVAACLVWAAPAAAQVADDAKAALMESADTMKKTSGLTFKAKRYATGPLKDIIDASGEIKIFRADPAAKPLVMVDGRVKNPGKGDKKVMFTNDGRMSRWLSYSDNTLYERPMPDGLSKQEMVYVEQLLVPAFYMGDAFEKDLKAEKVFKNGIDKVNGEVCDVIVAGQADGARATTWFISTNDRIPRRMELSSGVGADKISWVLDVTDVKINTKMSNKDFDLGLPTGFVKNSTQAAAPAAMPDMKPVELGLPVGTPAPAFSAKDSTGKDFNLSNVKGSVAVFEFWHPLVAPSFANSAEVQTLANEFKTVKFVSFACRGTAEQAAKKFKDNGLSYTLIPQGDSIVAPYKVVGFPSYYVLTPSGNVFSFFQSYPGKAALSQAITNAAAAK